MNDSFIIQNKLIIQCQKEYRDPAFCLHRKLLMVLRNVLKNSITAHQRSVWAVVPGS